MSNWINVKDRLPPNLEDVMVYEKYCEIPFIGWYNLGEEVWGVNTDFVEVIGDAYLENNVGAKNVTHWMPLPNPPESES
jgi:hypothetical protein